MIYTIFYLAGSRGCRYFLKKNKTIPQKELVIYKRGQYCYYISQKTLQVGTRIVKSSGCEEFVLKDMDSDETWKEQKDQL